MPATSTRELTMDQHRVITQTVLSAGPLFGAGAWRLESRDEAIHLYAVPTRDFSAAGPHGRALTIASGAALLILRLAVRALGREPIVRLLPTAAAPTHLARVRIGGTAGRDEGMDGLLAYARPATGGAVRSTDRPLPPTMVNLLHEAARVEGATLRPLLAGSDRVMVLATEHDRPADWLRAGQALQRVHLVAAQLGLSLTVGGGVAGERDQRLRPGALAAYCQAVVRVSTPVSRRTGEPADLPGLVTTRQRELR